ncbi:Rrf2 family transcriptional regulator [Verrucomicrobiaceae bacterium R5-34]|uniref:Rrf2 family transcriptional regulator n=1 Tax=Oceaniferula flava TaxID=2800421 RepID=A0AAE2SAA2_9BACT|nr:Rrf2 family transcriptional regulator [Oceaniferula flavus]MBK1832340.1 Rrf2 family transcriptional regulator [Verrucomicrobiaceae bacterium R5-34]MBK1854375.1 Rrf2 family transcriptional regulator [Oceaniferula flavus]MBM1135681.1 Rrf2 family transcriptional regulator [Oceaniferula flavus]
MKLTYYTDYAFRILIYMLLHPGETVSTRKIAEAYRISPNHLNKVSQKLVQLNMLEAKRGRGGGIKITKSALEWRLGDLVKELESVTELANCCGRSQEAPCVISPACHLRGLLAEVQATFYQSLNKYRVGNLIDKKSDAMRTLLTQ